MDASKSDSDPIPFAPRSSPRIPGASTGGAATPPAPHAAQPPAQDLVRFDRFELDAILKLYGRMVAAGEWRDYALDMGVDMAVFAVFRRTSEVPLYTIVKDPALARKQGTYRVVAASGYVLKRGHDLARVLAVFEKPRLVTP